MKHFFDRHGLLHSASISQEEEMVVTVTHAGRMETKDWMMGSGTWGGRRMTSFRWTTPVVHQVRFCCQVKPASWSTRRIVTVLTRGRPSGAWRSARCRVVSDQVAVPSSARSGGRCAQRVRGPRR